MITDNAEALHDGVRPGAPFAEVRVAPEPDSVDDRGVLELHLRYGRRVIVRPGFDRQTLRDLVATLEGGDGDVADREGGV